MKGFAFALVALCVVVLVDASPAKYTRPPACDIVCSQDYSPVCGAPPNDNSTKPRLFGNTCTLERHNCEQKSNWVKVSMDRCKNAGGVRLS